MKDSGILKPTAIGGFDKKSVLAYIDSLNEEFHEAELSYQEKISTFEKAQTSQLAHIHNLESKAADAEGKLAAVAEQLEKERELSRKAQSLIAELDSKNQTLQKKLDDQEREMQIQLERSRQLQFRLESSEHKSRKYDDLSTQIGDAIIEAKQNSERIVRAANLHAEEISRQAQDSMKNFYTELSSFNSDAVHLQKSVEEILFVLNDRVDVMQEIIRQVEQRFHASGSLLNYTEQNEPADMPDQPAAAELPAH